MARIHLDSGDKFVSTHAIPVLTAGKDWSVQHVPEAESTPTCENEQPQTTAQTRSSPAGFGSEAGAAREAALLHSPTSICQSKFPCAGSDGLFCQCGIICMNC